MVCFCAVTAILLLVSQVYHHPQELLPSYIDYIPSISFTYQTTSLPQYTQIINQPHQRIMDFIQISQF